MLHEATGEQLSEPRTARAQDKAYPTQTATQHIKQRHLRRRRYVKTTTKGSGSDRKYVRYLSAVRRYLSDVAAHGVSSFNDQRCGLHVSRITRGRRACGAYIPTCLYADACYLC
jgi:hypothetical protein